MAESKKQHKYSLYNVLVYFCALFSCLVPRYKPTFKLHLGIDFSLYSIAVIVTWFICVRRFRFYKRIECYYFLIWFVFIIGAVWRAQRAGIWASYVLWISVSLLFMQIIYHKPDRETFDIILRGLMSGLFIQLLIGLYEVTAHRYLFEVGTISTRLYGTVAVSMFMNLNDYVTFVITLLPFAIYFLMRSKKWYSKLFNMFLVVASVYLVIKSESRSGYLSLIMIVGTCIFLFWKRSRKTKTIISLIAVFLIASVLLIPQLRSGVETTFSNMMYDVSGNSDYVRVNMIKNGFHFLNETYGFGVGAGNLHYWLETRTVYDVNNILYIHNWYMEIMVTFGVLFFLIYVIWHIKNIRSLVSSVKAQSNFWTLNNTFLISFLAFTIVSIASSSNIYSEWVWMYLVLVPTYILSRDKMNKNTETQSVVL